MNRFLSLFGQTGTNSPSACECFTWLSLLIKLAHKEVFQHWGGNTIKKDTIQLYQNVKMKMHCVHISALTSRDPLY